MVTKGSYCLCIMVEEKAEINVGAIGTISFPRGYYIYIGSAMNSLKPRLVRHLITSKGKGRVIKWHIDYLLNYPGARIDKIYTVEGAAKKECEIASQIAEVGEPVPRFGSSDCHCRSHLYRVKSCRFLEKMGLKKIDIGRLLTSSPTQL